MPGDSGNAGEERCLGEKEGELKKAHETARYFYDLVIEVEKRRKKC